MKDAAKCDTWCELQDPASHRGFERKLRPRGPPGGTPARASARGRRPAETRPRVGRGHPPDLSISLGGGEETNRDSPSNGERNGRSSDLESGGPRGPPEL